MAPHSGPQGSGCSGKSRGGSGIPGGPGGCTEPSCPQGSSPLRDQGYGGPGIWGRGSRGVCTPDGGRQLLMR